MSFILTQSGTQGETLLDGPKRLEQPPRMAAALNEINTLQGALANRNAERPIFIFASGWRSGSTLLQRLCMSSGKALIWGEPFGPSSLFRSTSQPLRRMTRGLNRSRFLNCDKPVNGQDLSGKFIANLYPPLQSVLDAHINFWNTMLAEPAHRAGFERWGCKEVRLSIGQATYLQWVYPEAKFLFLIRNPYDAYLSYKRMNLTWYETWPEHPVSSASDFGLHWNKLATGFLNKADRFDSLTVRYEELHDPAILEELSKFLDLKIDASALNQRIDGKGPDKTGPQPTASELSKLHKVVFQTADKLGYRMPDRS